MGVKGLYSYLRRYRRPLKEKTLVRIGKRKRIGVDALSLLYKFRGELDKLFAALSPFHEAGFQCIFVMDGKAPETKHDEIEARREKRTEAQGEVETLRTFLENPESASMDERSRNILERRIETLEKGAAWQLTRQTRHALRDALSARGIPCLKANGEADDLLIAMYKCSYIDGIVSGDMDFLVAGTWHLFIPTTAGLEEVWLSEVLRNEDMKLEQFQDAAILCGIDTGLSYKHISPESAFARIRHYGSLEALMQKKPNVVKFPENYLEEIRRRLSEVIVPEGLVRDKKEFVELFS